MGTRSWQFAGAGVLIASVVLACAPALGGSWVYDDWATAEHPAQDDWQDLLSVFERDSSAYLFSSGVSPLGVTYRPLSMASLIAVQAAAPDAPWAHHLVSLALHLACTFGLWSAVSRVRGAPGSLAPWLIAGAFALHPVTIEAYAWINGRSDVLACAWLAALAWSLPLGKEAVGASRIVISAASAGAAVLSKEPAIIAVLALALAAALPDAANLRRPRRPAALAAAAGLFGGGAALLLRAYITRGQPSGAQVLFADPELPSGYARALALGLQQVVLPLPRTMLCLAHELARPADVADWAALSALTGLVLALLLGGRLRPALLLGGAFVSLLPVLAVRQLLWFGFDRYLYVPLFLIGLACADLRLPGLTGRSLRVAVTTALACLPLLGAASFGSARAYASQSAWLASLLTARPGDPSGYVMAAAWFLRRHDYGRARNAVEGVGRIGLAPPISHDLAEQLERLGLRNEAIDLMENTLRTHPNAAIARFDGLIAHTLRGRFDEADVLARQLAAAPGLCPGVRAWLTSLLERNELPPAERLKLERTLRDVHCTSLSVSSAPRAGARLPAPGGR